MLLIYEYYFQVKVHKEAVHEKRKGDFLLLNKSSSTESMFLLF
jgi:hypothetical protein